MREHTSPLKKAFDDVRRFFDRWGLTNDEIVKILEIDEEVYRSWLLSGAMSFERRIIARCKECYVLHEALLDHLSEERAFAWMQLSNDAPVFKGRTPIKTMCDEIKENPRIIREIVTHVRHEAFQ